MISDIRTQYELKNDHLQSKTLIDDLPEVIGDNLDRDMLSDIIDMLTLPLTSKLGKNLSRGSQSVKQFQRYVALLHKRVF